MIPVVAMMLMAVMGISLVGMVATGFGDEPSQKFLKDFSEVFSRKRKWAERTANTPTQ